ncbi:hypothetical protein GOP47_0006562, partial [Adiantum capillus-veneris]
MEEGVRKTWTFCGLPCLQLSSSPFAQHRPPLGLLSLFCDHLGLCNLCPPSSSNLRPQPSKQRPPLLLCDLSPYVLQPKSIGVSDMHQNGSVQLAREGDITRKVDLWLTFDQCKGYLKVRDVLDALDWDDVFYIDEKGFEIQISAHECGELQGFSTERFHADQILNVYGRIFFANEDPGAAVYDGIATLQEI